MKISAELVQTTGLKGVFDGLAPLRRKERVWGVVEAKTTETRQRRVGKAIAAIGDTGK